MFVVPRSPWLAVPGALLLAAGALSAQGTIHTWFGDVAYQGLGRAVSGLGDLNFDGKDEVLVGAPWDNFSGQNSGLVRIFDGGNGSIYTEFYGLTAQNEFGNAVAPAGDVNGDGRPDFLIAAMREDFNGSGSGRVWVYSGATLSALYAVDGDGSKDFLGVSIDTVGDVDGDGFDDWVAGAWEYDPGINPGPGIGYARVYSGVNGATIYTFNGANNLDFFGHSVAGVGDINGDGVPDIAVGAHGVDNTFAGAGNVSVFSGATGSLLLSLDGTSQGENLGFAVARAGDVDGDGTPDIVAGAPHDDTNGTNAGKVVVFSGATGAVLWTWYGDNAGDQLGSAVAGGFDLNGDGFADPVAGMQYNDTTGGNAGGVRLFDGQTGGVLWSAYGDATYDRLGYALAMAGDVNGDGVEDIVAGGPQYDNGPGPGNGMVRVYDPTGTPPPPPPKYPNLPTTFVTVGSGYSENFDGWSGSIPSYFGVNELNSLTRLYDPDAFCNVGQHGPGTGGASGIGPHSGAYDLEMGGFPGSTSGVTVSNGLIIGLDGTGTSGLRLSFWAANLGEEPDLEDGVFVSDNGLDWYQVWGNWTGLTANTWVQVTDVDLTTTSVNTAAPFYLLFAQRDNFALGSGDGVLVDDIEVGPPSYTLLPPSPGTAGQVNDLVAISATPGQTSYFIYGFQAGSTPVPGCGGLVADIRNPQIGGTAVADPLGVATLSVPVPPAASGLTVLLQAVEPGTCQVTNRVDYTFP